jgi:hypothetical protein
MTEAWWRNPHNYIREVVEAGVPARIAWDRGVLVKKKIDPLQHASLYFGESVDWECLLIGDQGTAYYKRGDILNKPTAVYPTWSYFNDDLVLLEELAARPVGEDPNVCIAPHLSPDQVPVLGQPHVIIINEMPDARSASGRQLAIKLKEICEDYPNCKIYLHGSYSWRLMFGLGFHMADVDPRIIAQKGNVTLPSGKIVSYEQAVKQAAAVQMLGFKPSDLQQPRERCIFNMRAAQWAAENWEKIYNPATRRSSAPVDSESSDASYLPVTTQSPFTGAVTVRDGDKFSCDTCSLQNQCKHFRSGAVCSVPGAEPIRLSKMFGSRDAQSIIDGLTVLTAAQANRLQRGMDDEQVLGELDPQVSKDLNSLFSNGVKLAQLLDPSLKGGPSVQVNVAAAGNAAVIAQSTPQELVSQVTRALAQRGVPADKITPEMIAGVLEGMTDPSRQTTSLQGLAIESGRTIQGESRVANDEQIF